MSRSPYGGAYLGRPPYSGKLSRDDVREVVRRYEAGEPVGAIARAFGVAHSAISYQVGKRCVVRPRKVLR